MLKGIWQVAVEAWKDDTPGVWGIWPRFFQLGVGLVVVVPVFLLIWGSFSLGALLAVWAAGGIFLSLALALRSRVRPGEHRACVTCVVEATGRSYYYAMCSCGWIDVPIESSAKAFAAARKHSKRIDDEVVERVVSAG